ncbi:hypothetical protein BAE44_0023204 [Dichanthelium oligosanthes]|uniref:Uncharacterized protein n=1 Tax=Dichanthelium oligosanthes TaxID=888268 RepID=A0A1E5USB4_9POAL|nr:hypothetical protein BAE44_0023204 [Dichanthelium oligosanthes]
MNKCLISKGCAELLKATGDVTSYPYSVTNSTSYSIAVKITSVDQREIVLKFCFEFDCNTCACYCCKNRPKILHCFYTRDQCLRACPACNPKCPPRTLPRAAIMERAMVNVTLCCPELVEGLEAGDTTGHYTNSATNMSSNAIKVNNTSAEESKIYLKFCLEYDCMGVPCYCCDNQVEYCFYTRDDQCFSTCPACNPVCPTRTLLHTTTERAAVNVTL